MRLCHQIHRLFLLCRRRHLPPPPLAAVAAASLSSPDPASGSSDLASGTTLGAMHLLRVVASLATAAASNGTWGRARGYDLSQCAAPPAPRPAPATSDKERVTCFGSAVLSSERHTLSWGGISYVDG